MAPNGDQPFSSKASAMTDDVVASSSFSEKGETEADGWVPSARADAGAIAFEDRDTEARLCQDLIAKLHVLPPEDIAEERFICDLGYGLPKEPRPRKEKILAIARQLVNFLLWRQQQQQEQSLPVSHIFIVLGKSVLKEVPAPTTTDDSQFEKERNEACGPETMLIQDALLERMLEIWMQHDASLSSTTREIPFPDQVVSFVHEPLHEFLHHTCGMGDTGIRTDDHDRGIIRDVVYLSPDATTTLDITKFPPKNIIIGLLIDRRSIQHNRSFVRARENHIPSARLPLDCFSDVHKNEPLNVDCVLEGMQQWCWNIKLVDPTARQRHRLDSRTFASDLEIGSPLDQQTIIKTAFESAFIQAMQHHCSRHPQRPLHKTPSLKSK